ncbi:hypothetical protein [uncultured Tateyamaria sp.]|uniref:hypothetical protein n=1 Tax=Tateyamaria sp. 1078 TaxID=3417464 RepID=UPI0026169FB7|nr:hypothetical protein [uncultured Tateyamaria sp.]
MTDRYYADDLVGLEFESFQPIAYFDKHMDSIRVFTRDCSVTEVRFNGAVTLHQNNDFGHDGEPLYVGFTIKGIKFLLERAGLPQEGVVELSDIVNRLVKIDPASTMAAAIQLAFSYTKATAQDRHLKVDFSEAA